MTPEKVKSLGFTAKATLENPAFLELIQETRRLLFEEIANSDPSDFETREHKYYVLKAVDELMGVMAHYRAAVEQSAQLELFEDI